MEQHRRASRGNPFQRIRFPVGWHRVTVEHVQTKREIEAVLMAAGIVPRKRFGQHFLVDGNLMRRLVDAADIQREDCVLEVGGGTGGLTDLLVLRAARVICVEVDRAMQAILAERFHHRPGFTLVRGDVLADKHRISEPVADLLASCSVSDGQTVKLVSNLPYQAATPLVLNLLLDFPAVRKYCFTVQAEVGERILSPPGNKNYGPLSVLMHLLCNGELLARLPPSVFWPRPQVDSVMIRLDVKGDSPLADRSELRRFSLFVRRTFDHRRKMLRAALAYHVDSGSLEAACPDVDFSRRPEQLDVEEWLVLFRAIDQRVQ
jgi:16S rRNA (adenine1518-N6/adenine1519-N6)-dimethyltransferase